MLSCIINMVLYKVQFLFLLWFAIYHVNAYGLNSVVFNVLYT